MLLETDDMGTDDEMLSVASLAVPSIISSADLFFDI